MVIGTEANILGKMSSGQSETQTIDISQLQIPQLNQLNQQLEQVSIPLCDLYFLATITQITG